MASATRDAEPGIPALGTPPAPPTVLDLPAAVELLIFSQLTASELAACMATCRAWRQSAAAPELWQAACEQRWRSCGSTGQLSALARQGHWLEVYRLRRQVRLFWKACQGLPKGTEGAGTPWGSIWPHPLPLCLVIPQLVPAAPVLALPPQTDAQTLALLAELQHPERRRAALAQLRQAGNFAETTDLLQQLIAGAEGLRQPVLPQPGPESASAALAAVPSPAGPASASSALSWADPVEGSAAEARWPDAVAAAAAAPCAAAYWARSVHSELCVRHWAQRMRSVAARAAAAQAELSRRRSRPAGADAPGGAASTAQAQPSVEPPVGQQPAGGAAEPPGAGGGGSGGGQGQGHREEQQGGGDAGLSSLPEEQGGGDAGLAGLPEEQLELLLGLALEEGGLALAHVHSPRAGEPTCSQRLACLMGGMAVWLMLRGGHVPAAAAVECRIRVHCDWLSVLDGQPWVVALWGNATALPRLSSGTADLRWVSEALDALGKELRRRMREQGELSWRGVPARPGNLAIESSAWRMPIMPALLVVSAAQRLCCCLPCFSRSLSVCGRLMQRPASPASTHLSPLCLPSPPPPSRRASGRAAGAAHPDPPALRGGPAAAAPAVLRHPAARRPRPGAEGEPPGCPLLA